MEGQTSNLSEYWTATNQFLDWLNNDKNLIDVNSNNISIDFELPLNVRQENIKNISNPYSNIKASRSHNIASMRARRGKFQSSIGSLTILQKIIQKSINKEIDSIIQKYMKDFFQPAIDNIKQNLPCDTITQDYQQIICQQILIEAMQMYGKRNCETLLASSQLSDLDSSFEEPREAKLSKILIKRKKTYSTSSESSYKLKSIPIYGKRNCDTLLASSQLSEMDSDHPSYEEPYGAKLSKPDKQQKMNSPKNSQNNDSQPVIYLGDKEIGTETLFVMGSKANKALGLGATRGRLYKKHPNLFRYPVDLKDKQWLNDSKLIIPTAGRLFLLLLDEVQELAQSDEYRKVAEHSMNDLVGFQVPSWMLNKMNIKVKLTDDDTSQHIASSPSCIVDISQANVSKKLCKDQLNKNNTQVSMPGNIGEFKGWSQDYKDSSDYLKNIHNVDNYSVFNSNSNCAMTLPSISQNVKIENIDIENIEDFIVTRNICF